MQANKSNILTRPYTGDMKTGRPAKTTRSEFGTRLHAMREEAGLSQQHIAEELGISQPAYASWERRNVAIQPAQLIKLASIFGVGVEALLCNSKRTSRRGGPPGRLRQVFEQVSGLPRQQQSKVIEFVEAFVEKKTAGY